MSAQFEGAPLPYSTLEIGAHTASGGCQIYLTDINGRKIGCVWGKAGEKAFTAHLLATAASLHDTLVSALEWVKVDLEAARVYAEHHEKQPALGIRQSLQKLDAALAAAKVASS